MEQVDHHTIYMGKNNRDKTCPFPYKNVCDSFSHPLDANLISSAMDTKNGILYIISGGLQHGPLALNKLDFQNKSCIKLSLNTDLMRINLISSSSNGLSDLEPIVIEGKLNLFKKGGSHCLAR